jgi:hypothetical protein
LVTLTQAGGANPTIPHRPDDRSDHRHRQLIGYVGLLLPIVLFLFAGLFPTAELPRWGVLTSISAYYYTAAVAAFIGLLVALALFLFTYRGYRNRYRLADRAAAITAGVAALGVAIFPAEAPVAELQLGWWSSWMRYVHYGAAVVLFTTFAVFSLWLFRLASETGPLPADKVRRNRVYLICGIAIVIGMVWAFLAGLRGRSIFLPETVVLVAFAVSWLTKGYATRSITQTVRSVIT